MCDYDANLDAKADDGSTSLHLAVVTGHADTVRLLCERGATVNAKSPYGNTPLHLARNHFIVRTLCEHGATLDTEDKNGKTPFWTAVFFLANQETMSHDSETWECFQELLNAGCDINARDSSGYTPLLRILDAREEIDPALIKKLIRAGADTRLRADNGAGVLRLCSSKHAYKQLLKAIGRGLDIDTKTIGRLNSHVAFIRNKYDDPSDREHELVYMWVRDSLEDLPLLRRLGSDVDVTNSAGWTAVHWAASEGDTLVIDRLLAAGASLGVYSAQKGRSPLAVAVHYQKLEAARLLLRYGSDPHAKGPSAKAENALDVADRVGGGVMLELLRPGTSRTPGTNPTSVVRAKVQPAATRITEPLANEQRLLPTSKPRFRADLQGSKTVLRFRTPSEEPSKQQEHLRQATRPTATPPRAVSWAQRPAHVKYPLPDSSD